jgi:hypothetical protein
MQKRSKRLLVYVGLALLVVLVFCMLVPQFEYQWRYCFYCGRTTHVQEVCGFTWRSEVFDVESSSDDGELMLEHGPARGYGDGIRLPSHDHVMIESSGGYIWYPWGAMNRDEFGLTGAVLRIHLRRALAAMPERRPEIIGDYMLSDPSDEEACDKFARKYGITNVAAQPTDGSDAATPSEGEGRETE